MNHSGGGTQIQLPQLSKINKILIIIIASTFILQSLLGKFAGISIANVFGLSANYFFRGMIFQIGTYPFFASGIMEVIFGGLILWFLGSELETNWGAKRYIGFMATSYIGAGLVYLCISVLFFTGHPVYSYPLVGLQGVTNALCLAYAIIHPNRTFLFMLIFPIKTKYFCGLLVVIQLYMGIIESSNVSGALAWGHLASMGFAFLYMMLISSDGFKQYLKNIKKKKSKAKLKVLYGDKNDEKKPPKYWQ